MYRKLRTIVFLILAFLVSCDNLTTEQKRKIAAIQLLEASNTPALLESMYEKIDDSILKYIESLAITPETSETAERYTQDMVRLARDEINWKDLENLLSIAYIETFSIKEMNEISKFYNTPTGKKMLIEMPKLSQKNLTILKNLVQGLTPKLQHIMDKLTEELKKQTPINPGTQATSPTSKTLSK